MLMNESLFGFLRPISAHHYHHLASRNFWAEMHIPKMFASALVALEFLLCKNKTWIMEFYAQAKTDFEKQEFKISCFSFDLSAAASSFLFSFSEVLRHYDLFPLNLETAILPDLVSISEPLFEFENFSFV